MKTPNKTKATCDSASCMVMKDFLFPRENEHITCMVCLRASWRPRAKCEPVRGVTTACTGLKYERFYADASCICSGRVVAYPHFWCDHNVACHAHGLPDIRDCASSTSNRENTVNFVWDGSGIVIGDFPASAFVPSLQL